MLATRSFAYYPVVSYVLPSGVTFFFALPNDPNDHGWRMGYAYLVGASPNTYYDSIGTTELYLLGDMANGDARSSCFSRYYNLAADLSGSCHYLNEHESSYNGELYDVVIPDTITFPNGSQFPVVCIASTAFSHADWIHSVSIPNTVREISERAFFHCRNLEKILIGTEFNEEDFIFINQWAFAACYNLKKLEINMNCHIEPAGFFNDVIDTVEINSRKVERENLVFSSGIVHELTQDWRHSEIFYGSPFYHQGPSVNVNDTSWRGHTTLVLGDNVESLQGVLFDMGFGGDTMVFPQNLKRLDYWSTLHRNYILPDSLKSFGLLNLKEATNLTIPDGISTWIRLGWLELREQHHSRIDYYDLHTICGKKIKKITIGKRINAIYNITDTGLVYSLDTVVIKSRKIQQMSVRSFPIRPLVLYVPCGKMAAYQSMLGATAVYLNIIEDTNCHVEVVVQSANEQFGSVSGGGIYPLNTSVTLTAVPYDGYIFQRWSNGRTTNPMSFVVDDDTVVTAYFIQEQNDIGNVIGDQVKISTEDGCLSVWGTTEDVRVYDMMGRLVLATKGSEEKMHVPISGVYMVKVGGYPARKVVVIR